MEKNLNKTILITGGCGFVGHHIVEHYLKNTDWDIIIFDKLSYASNGLDRVRDIEAYDNKRVKIFTCDLTKYVSLGIQRECKNVNYIVHLAAESHVDRSIIYPVNFAESNVIGTIKFLNFAKSLESLENFIYFSTDEVFGPAPVGVNYKENDPYNATNPYSASKASAEQFCVAYNNCYHIPITITRSMNIFGERQHPEKFIPLCINKILKNETIQIHSSSDKKVSGSRYYIHARNVANAIDFIIKKSVPLGIEFYNIVGESEISNLDLANMIGDVIGKQAKIEMVDFHSQRPGHDLRYALDGGKMESIGWHIPIKLENSLEKTVNWFLDNRQWLMTPKELNSMVKNLDLDDKITSNKINIA